jgi:hypothetical protein
MLNSEIYNAFNLLIADNHHMMAIIGYGASRRIEIRHFDPGLHVATGWGVDNWEAPRESIIKKEFGDGDKLQWILCQHGDNSEKGAICVHNSSSHVTVSSCIISIREEPAEVVVRHVQGSPCRADHWGSVRMVL